LIGNCHPGIFLLAQSRWQGKLSRMSTTGGFEPSDGSMQASGADSAVAEQDPLVGKVIGSKYQILSFLGKGGMSVVYKAKQHPINRIVALKMLLAHLSKNEGSVKRFLQEATAAGQLTHPNVVNVFDFGLTEDGQPYLVMDFVQGESLAQIIATSGPMHYREALPLFIQICDGLIVAHEKGVIHRDIKPSNLVIEERPDGKCARIVDFGIAKMLDAESQQLTKTGEIFGSPFYMSPEQCEGRQLDSRSDLYSLGIVFYEVLSGMVPLAGQSSLETMRLHMEQMPESFQRSAPASDIPLALENIVFKMIAKSREKRYPNARAVKAELETLLGGDSNALSGNLEYVGREISRKSKTITTVATAGGILALLAVLSLLSYPHVCAAIADDQYNIAQTALKQNDLKKAESCLKTSIDLGRNIHNAKMESRGLDSIISLYRREGKREALTSARKRKQELIKAELSTLGISDEFIDNYVSAQVQPVKDSSTIAMSNSAAKEADESSAAAKHQAAKEEEASLDSAASNGAAKKTVPSLKNQKMSPSSRPVPAAATQSASGVLMAPLPKNAPYLDSTDAVAALPSPPPPPPILRGEASTAKKVGVKDVREEHIVVSGETTKARRPNGNRLSILDSRMPIQDYRARKNEPPSLQGGGGVDQGSSVLSGDGSSGGSGSAAKPGFAGSTNGTIAPGVVLPSNKQKGFGARIQNAIVSMTASPDALERLEVMLDYCIEHNSYERAVNCANAAITMYGMLKYNPDEELAQLYASRAFAQFKRHRIPMAKNDAWEALQIVGPDGQSQAGAEAETVIAMIFAKNGKQKNAIERYQHAQTRLADPNSSLIVREGISGLN
jgi:serine/threonine-protein kinase